jgi:signal transduction histidine kinase
MIFRSVTSQLVFFHCLLLVLLGGGFLTITVLSFQHYTRETMADNLSARAQEIWNISQSSLDQPLALADVIERRFSPESQDRFIRIRAGGTLLYRSENPTGGDFSAQDVPLRQAPDSPQDAAAVLLGNLLLYSESFQNADGRVITIDNGQSFLFARTLQRQLAASLSVALPLLLLLAALAGYVLMRRALVPVEAMINAAETYTFNEPHKRLPTVGTEPRIEALGVALNRMLDRLDSAYSHVSRFSADAAHELRTPLTIIRGELELVASQGHLSPDIGNAIGNALEEMTRLSGIVDNLVTLSRMESLWGKRSHAPVDLRELAVDTIDQMNLMAVEKQITLNRPAGGPVIVAGDRERLKQVLVNLLDNAVKYTPPGGQVTVETGIENGTGFIQVEDTGIGIDPDHHERIFDRFYRVSPDRGDGGAGLGLAIVKSICHAHGGSASLRSAPEIGSCFRVVLPLLSGGAESMTATAEATVAIDLNNRASLQSG